MKQTINLSIIIDTDKPKADIQNAIQKGLYYGLDVERVAEPKKILSIDFDTQVTKDDLEDLKVLIVGNLVIEGIIKDCTDTDDQTESEAQDVVYYSLCSRLEQLNKLQKNDVNCEDEKRKFILDYLTNHIEYHSILLDCKDKYNKNFLTELDNFDLRELAELWDY